MRIRPYLNVGPRVHVTRPGPRAGCLWRLGVLLLVLACARSLAGQEVTAIATLGRDSVAELHVGNRTAAQLHVSLALHRDGGSVVLGDTVAALISPTAFTLGPGEWQLVRIKIRAPVAPGEVLRLATLFAPPREVETGQRVQLAVAVRIVSKVRAP